MRPIPAFWRTRARRDLRLHRRAWKARTIARCARAAAAPEWGADRASSLFGEFRRMARTSGAVGGIAARMVGERAFGIRTDRADHAEDLREHPGWAEGPVDEGGAVPVDRAGRAAGGICRAELAQLQANAPAMGWAFVRRRMAGELGPDWETALRRFEHEASAAASPRPGASRTLPDGSEVACKLQYPDMASTVDADLRQLKLAMAVYHRMDGAIQHDEIYVELAERLREELDYKREAAQMRLYGDDAEGCAGRAYSGADRRVQHPAPVDHDLAGWPPADAPAGGRPAAGGAQPHRRGAVPRLVRAVLPLWRDPWRPASRQLPGAPGCQREPAGFRRHPRVPGEVRPRRDRSVRGGARQRRGQGACTPTPPGASQA